MQSKKMPSLSQEYQALAKNCQAHTKNAKLTPKMPSSSWYCILVKVKSKQEMDEYDDF